MSDAAWRTIVVESGAALRIEDGMMIDDAAERMPIPVCEIRNMIIRSETATLSSGLINSFADNNTVVFFCDKKYNPSALLTPISNHYNVSGNTISQTEWTNNTKAEVWQKIIQEKIRNQATLIQLKGKEEYEALFAYSYFDDPDDADAVESAAARLYFKALFGFGFIRHSSDDTNSALNYGYVVLCSAITRLLTMHGYCTSLGIHHKSVANRFNLSCDLMEPFNYTPVDLQGSKTVHAPRFVTFYSTIPLLICRGLKLSRVPYLY